MTMYPVQIPQIPLEMHGPMMDNPGGFHDAITSGMDAFQQTMQGGGDHGAAFEAFGGAAGPMIEEMGVPPDIFNAVGEMLGAVVGPAMMMGPADCGGAEMGAMLMDGISMMMPPDMEMPQEMEAAMTEMGTAMADAGVQPHEIAVDMMPPPGDPGYPLPVGADGGSIGTPGDPGSFPMSDMNGDPILQAPPADGALADIPNMMPPDGGYAHLPMGEDMMMSEPMTMDLAMGGEGQGGPGQGEMPEFALPSDAAPFPPETLDAMGADGGAPFVTAMAGGMEAFQEAMVSGGGMEAAGDAFMTHMHEGIEAGAMPGMTHEMFDQAGDMFMDSAGTGLMTLPADASPTDMGQVFGEAFNDMIPDEFDLPQGCEECLIEMGASMGEAGIAPHDLGTEFGPEMPEGFVAGDPSTLPDGEYSQSSEFAQGGEGQGGPGAGDDGGLDALSSAMGGPTFEPDGTGMQPADQGLAAADAAMDAAIGSAMDEVMDQGGPETVNPMGSEPPEGIDPIMDAPADEAVDDPAADVV